MISVLIPSRGRFNGLKKAVVSLLETCSSKENIEILIKFDEDDRDSMSRLNELPKEVQYFITPRGRGYYDFHKYANFLAEKSKGDFLFIFNDDAVMTVQDWDKKFTSPDSYVVYDDGCFPCISRKLYNLLGHFSSYFLTDAYLDVVGKEAGILRQSGVRVRHDEAHDHVRAEGTPAYREHNTKWDEEKPNRDWAVQKIKEAIANAI